MTLPVKITGKSYQYFQYPEALKNAERYFVPWEGFVGLISKAWDELTPEERKVAVPVSETYRNQRLF